MTFSELGVPADYCAALAAHSITEPFPIQTSTLPDSLAGRDVLGRGRTGSGKTIAFCLPVAIRLSGRRSKPGAPRAMILVPTRELATQVAEAMRPLAKAAGLRVTTIVGGVAQGSQVSALRGGVDIVVATPGRLEDLIKQRHCRLDSVEISVLDEADHLADLGFLPASKRLLDQTPRGGLPDRHGDGIAAHVLTVDDADKQQIVRELVSGHQRTVAFTRTKHGAKKLAKQLSAAGIPAADLHGNLSQGARQRNLAAFSDGTVRVLVATDIAARGIHVDGIDLVLHVDPPAEHKTYLHRCGRTARAGAQGMAVTVGTHGQRREIQRMIRKAEVFPTTISVTPGDEAIREIVGPHAPKVRPPAVVVPVQQARRRRPGRTHSGRRAS